MTLKKCWHPQRDVINNKKNKTKVQEERRGGGVATDSQKNQLPKHVSARTKYL